MAETLTDNQIKPFLKNFEEISIDCEYKKFNQVKKTIAKIEKTLKKKYEHYPWLELYKALWFSSEDKYDEAVDYVNKILAAKPFDHRFIQPLITVMRNLGMDEEILPLYKKMVNERPKNTDLLHSYIIHCVIANQMKEAQESAMALVKINGTPSNKLLCAVLFFFRAKQENNPVYYKFAKSFLMQVKPTTFDAIYILFKSYIAIGENENALALVQSNETREHIGYDKLGLARLEIEAYEALGKLDEVGKCAEKVLREIDADSLEEWRLVVKHNPNAQQIINDLSNGKFRGPMIAQIELDLKEGKDISQRLLDYANNKPNGTYLFGDLRKYITEDIKGKVASINDKALKAYITGEFDGEPENGREAIIKSETLLAKYKKGDQSKLQEAIEVCSKFASAEECMLMLIRLSSIVGATSLLGDLQQKLKLEAILLLSTGNMLFGGVIKNLDIKVLCDLSTAAINFCQRSISSYFHYFRSGFEGNHFIAPEQTVVIRQQIMHHLIRYLSKVLQLWLALLTKDKEAPVDIIAKQLVSGEEIEKMINITDETPLPVFVEDAKDVIYPNAVPLTKAISAIARVLVAATEDDRNKALEDIPEGEYRAFYDAVKSDFADIKTDNLFVIASLAILAEKLGKKVDSLNGIIDSYVESRNKAIDSFNGVMKDSVTQQKERLDDAIKHIKSHL